MNYDPNHVRVPDLSRLTVNIINARMEKRGETLEEASKQVAARLAEWLEAEKAGAP